MTEIMDDAPNDDAPNFADVEFSKTGEHTINMTYNGRTFARVQHEDTFSTSSYYISRRGPDEYESLTDEVLLVWAFRASEALESEGMEE